MRWVKALVLAAALSACSLVATSGPGPGPQTHREIWWENHTPNTYEMRITEGGHFSAAGLVEPCAPGGMGQPLEEVFGFELAALGDPTSPGDRTSEPGTPVTDWRAWEDAGDQHVVAVIRTNGEVEVDLRAEPPSMDEDSCP